MSKRPTIAEVLHLAADKYLEYDHYYGIVGEFHKRELFSCDAVDSAAWESFQKWDHDILFDDFIDPIMRGLENMGVNTSSSIQFIEYSNLEERQGARYAWLKFAAMMAEEQGV